MNFFEIMASILVKTISFLILSFDFMGKYQYIMLSNWENKLNVSNYGRICKKEVNNYITLLILTSQKSTIYGMQIKKIFNSLIKINRNN